ncbi:MAG TPA: hypothetical protein VGB07_14995, partial [Blastocatellia bacterium]
AQKGRDDAQLISCFNDHLIGYFPHVRLKSQVLLNEQRAVESSIAIALQLENILSVIGGTL